jgi:hypothetical protein
MGWTNTGEPPEKRLMVGELMVDGPKGDGAEDRRGNWRADGGGECLRPFGAGPGDLMWAELSRRL